MSVINFHNFVSKVSSIFIVCVLSACGGGGGGGQTANSTAASLVMNSSSLSVVANSSSSLSSSAQSTLSSYSRSSSQDSSPVATSSSSRTSVSSSRSSSHSSSSSRSSSRTSSQSSISRSSSSQSSATRSQSKVMLPIEIIGEPGLIESVDLPVTSSANATTIKLTTHRLEWREDGEFATTYGQPNAVRPGSKGSMRLNGGAWLPLTNATVTCEKHEAQFGCLNGSYATVRIKIPLISLGSPGVKTGVNNVEFRFDTTDGISSGWRILNMDIVNSTGDSLLQNDIFEDDNPDLWTPPLNNTQDIAQGKILWQTANLTDLGFSNSRHAINGKCASCHFRDASDLAYFNYSNKSIIARSMFHGLSELQAKQIASYVRSIDLKLPQGYTRKDAGRAWNPPYQPGPGLDDKPVELWAAGAGLAAVLEDDLQMKHFMFPNGEYKEEILGANGFLNPRETPQALQYPDWNAWVPAMAIEDMVSDPTQLASSPHFTKLKTADDWLTNYRYSDDEWLFEQGLWNLKVWRESQFSDGNFVGGFWYTDRDQPNRTVELELKQTRYNLAKLAWFNLRMMEMQLKHKLQDITDRAGMMSYVDDNGVTHKREIPVGYRSWSMPNRTLFETAPHFVSDGVGLTFNYTKPGNYLSTAWYSMEQIVNGGWRAGSFGLDWNYHPGHISNTHRSATGFYNDGAIHLYRHAWSTFWLYQSMPADWTPQSFAFRQRQIGIGLDVQFSSSDEDLGLTFADRKQLQDALALAFLGVAERYSTNQWHRRTADTEALRSADNFETVDYVAHYVPPQNHVEGWCEWGYQADCYYERIKILKDNQFVTDSTLNRLVNWGLSVWPKGEWEQLRP